LHVSKLRSIQYNASIDSITGSPDSADFAATQLLIHCHITLWRLQYANGLTTIVRVAKMDHRLLPARAKNKMASVGSSCNGCACNGWHIPATTARYTKGLSPICPSWGSESWVAAKSAESVELVFTWMDVLLCGLLPLRRPIFKQKKGPGPLV
jgi:hypothetical protein